MLDDRYRLMCVGRFLLASLTIASVSFEAHGGTPVPVWRATYRRAGTANAQYVRAFRTLADGSLLVAGQDANTDDLLGAVSAVHYGPTGLLLGVASMYTGYVDTVALDPFGGLYAGLESSVMRFDGLTGRAVWPGPATFGAVYSRVGAILPGRSGGVFVTGSGGFSLTTAKYDVRTGALLWGPISHALWDTSNGPYFLRETPNGDVVLAGGKSSGELVVVKYAGGSGATLWGPFVRGASSPRDMLVDATGDVFLGTQAGVLKLNGATGAEVWGPVGPAGTLAMDPSGDVYIGATTGSPGTYDLTLSRRSGSSGALVWGPVLHDGGSNDTGPVGLATDGLGGLLVAGQSTLPGGSRMVVLKYAASTGSLLWGPSLVGVEGYNSLHALALDGNGSPILSGTGGPTDFVTAKLDGLSGVTTFGPLVFTGQANYFEDGGSGALAPGGSLFYSWISYDQGAPEWAALKVGTDSGAIQWGPVIPALVGYPAQTCTDPAGHVIIGGASASGSTTELAVLKLDGASGDVLWGPSTYSSVGGAQHYLFAMGLDPAGDALVIGAAYSPASTTILKFSGATGSAPWPGLTLGSQPYSGAFDSSGDVLVGSAAGLTKVSGATGAVQWGPVAPANVLRIAVDAARNVFALRAGGGDLELYKYAPTGGLLWGPIPAGLAGKSPSANALAVDADGDVIVTAYAAGGGADRDWTTVKWTGATGTLAWGPVYLDGPAHHDDFPQAIAFDASGNVIVAGTASESSSPYRSPITIVKYDEANGSVLWGPVVVRSATPRGNVRYLTMTGGDILLAGLDGEFGGAPTSLFLARLTEGLGIETLPSELAPANCGLPYQASLVARNGAPPYTWTVVSGSLPAGLQLDPESGTLAGSPAAEGIASFRVRVSDSASAHAERDYEIAVIEGQDPVLLVATPSRVCPGGSTVLSVPGSFTDYLWYPGLETTASIRVSPAHPTLYGVRVSGTDGCARTGSTLVEVSPVPAPQTPVITAPTAVPALAAGQLASISPTPGSSYLWSIQNGTLTSGQGSASITFTAGPIGAVELTVVETAASGCVSSVGSKGVAILPRKGDVNGDGLFTPSDITFLANFLYANGPAPIGPGDANADGSVTLLDIVHLANDLDASR